MKVLLASSSSGSKGGGELFLLKLGQGLHEQGHQVIFWCSNHERMNSLAQKFTPFAQVVRADYANTYDRWGRSWAAARDGGTASRIAQDWKERRPDIVHVNKQNLEDGLDLLNAARLSQIPSVATIHIVQSMESLHARFASIRDKLTRENLQRYPGPWVVVYEPREKELRQFLRNDSPIQTVRNGVSIPSLEESVRTQVRRELGIKNEEKLFIAIGRMVEQKRPQLFLQFARHMRSEGKFVWVGDGKQAPAWDRFIEQHNLTENVERLSWSEDISGYLAAADFFVHPAQFEGLPFALLEAMAAGVPCLVAEDLASDLPFLNKENFLTLPIHEPRIILPDSSLTNRIGIAGKTTMSTEFSFAGMIHGYERVYEQARNLSR